MINSSKVEFCMLKNVLTIFITLTMISAYSSVKPNETKIYYHIHQATIWAELHYLKKYLFSKQEIEKHLGKIKYSELKLVNSIFYKEYLFLNKLSRNLEKSSFVEVEKLREGIHAKAERFKIEHPINWESEFTLHNL